MLSLLRTDLESLIKKQGLLFCPLYLNIYYNELFLAITQCFRTLKFVELLGLVLL